MRKRFECIAPERDPTAMTLHLDVASPFDAAARYVEMSSPIWKLGHGDTVRVTVRETDGRETQCVVRVAMGLRFTAEGT